MKSVEETWQRQMSSLQATTESVDQTHSPLEQESTLEKKKVHRLMYIGDMMSVQVIIEGSMNSSNPYFSSSWSRNFTGGFILDMGVYYIAGLRMMVGCEVALVSAMKSILTYNVS